MEDFWPTVHMQVDAFIQNRLPSGDEDSFTIQPNEVFISVGHLVLVEVLI